MTEGLLNKSFHDLAEVRGTLVDSVFVAVGEVLGQPLQAVSLPLFRHGAAGLEQVVRFRLPSLGLPRLSLFVSAGNDALRSKTGFADLGAFTQAEIAVPEVSAPRPLRFEVLGDAAEVLWAGEVVVAPQRKWSISLVHHTHLDVGYTDPQALVIANHLQYLDSVLDLVERTEDWDDDARFRWNVEVNWPLELWLGQRGKADQHRMLDAVRSGRISVGAISLNLHTEACAVEELYEMVRFGVELRRRHGLSITSAMQTDVPGGVTALVEALSDAGVRYLSVAHNFAGRSVPYLIGGEILSRPFWWRAPSGKRLLVWHTDTLHGNAYMEGNILGLAESVDLVAETLPCYLLALATRSYPFDSGVWLREASKVERPPYPHDFLHLRVQGRYGDNAPPNLAVSEVARGWNSSWAYPHLRVETNEGFFEGAEDRLGESITEWAGDWADWWADGLGSGARMVGWGRQAQSSLRTGRTVFALSDLLNGSPVVPLPSLRSAYADVGLFDEHTWGARHPWGNDEEGWGSGELQWQRKAAFAQSAREAGSTLVSSGAHRASQALSGRGELGAVVVINTCGWERSDVVSVFVPHSAVPASLQVVVEDDGSSVATRAEPQQHANHRPAGRLLSFLARQVPALGYKRFSIVAGAPVAVEVRRPGSSVVENELYRVEYSALSACIASIGELTESKRELVNQSALFGVNSYIFDRYGTATRVDHLSGRVFSRDLDLVAERATAGPAVVVRSESSELGETMTVEVAAPGCSKLATTISAWRGVPRIDIANRIWKDKTTEKQSVFFAFPFAGEDPEVIYELPGIGTAASSPVVPGCPRHMRAIRHWVALRSAAGGVAWASHDAPLVQLGDIHSPYTPFPGTLPPPAPERGTIYSWALNNIWDTNFPTEQAGEMVFRYSIASCVDQGADLCAMRLGEAASTPLVATFTASREAGGERPPSGSLAAIEDTRVRLVQATESNAGNDVLLWLNNVADEEVATTVFFPDLAVKRANWCTVLEEGRSELAVRDGSVTVRLAAGETRALALDLDHGGHGAPGRGRGIGQD